MLTPALLLGIYFEDHESYWDSPNSREPLSVFSLTDCLKLRSQASNSSSLQTRVKLKHVNVKHYFGPLHCLSSCLTVSLVLRNGELEYRYEFDQLWEGTSLLKTNRSLDICLLPLSLTSLGVYQPVFCQIQALPLHDELQISFSRMKLNCFIFQLYTNFFQACKHSVDIFDSHTSARSERHPLISLQIILWYFTSHWWCF
jgi:hypothetical protein